MTEQTPLLKYQDNLPVTAVTAAILDNQISEQDRQLRQGQERVIKQEERVLEYLSEGAREILLHEQQVKELKGVKEHLEELSAKLDKEIAAKQKEHRRKVEQEMSLLERCREYLQTQKQEVEKEHQKLYEKTRIRRVNEDVFKLQGELEKALRDQRLMGMIADNYVKEINKRKQSEEPSGKPKTPDGTARGT